MSNQGYDEELRSEREYVASLYGRLDTERLRVREAYAGALRGEGFALSDREVSVGAKAREMARLKIADEGLCFGRLDALSGDRSYVGRIGLFDEENDYEPLVLDWRAPASRAFYCATGASPEGMSRRRQFRTLGRQVLDFTDEVFGRPESGERGDVALLAAVNAPRGEGMRDIVATIQAEQDEIIRLDHAGVVVVEGGPGTGKTAVALHRVAYLLYTKRERMERRGVLVVGPSSGFLDHIGRVLPSLGETSAVFATPGGLVAGLSTEREDPPEVQRLKGSLAILDVLAAAVADRQELPSAPEPIELDDVTVVLDAEVVAAAREVARDSGLLHNEAKSVFEREVIAALAERGTDRLGAGWLPRDDEHTRPEMLKNLRRDLEGSVALGTVLDRLWPVLTPQRLLAGLYASPERLRAAGADPALFREDAAGWTVSDVPLLDEAVELLGSDRAAERRAAERRRLEQREYAERVLEIVEVEEDHDDYEFALRPTDVLKAEDLAERFAERDERDLAERAAADREWTYGHVVVDEAQELSEMDWRVLMRRCPSRSFTVVGDLAQRRSPSGARSWDTMLSRYVADRWLYRKLTVNYRTPSEIMTVAAAVLAGFAPDVVPPESVRSCGVRPWARPLSEMDIEDAVAEFVREESGREGTAVVIGPPGVPGAITPSAAKGLEYDAVLVVEPERILAEGPNGEAELYVALTRATQRLGVLYSGRLPKVLRGLDSGRRTPDAFLRCV
ncbi:RNA polymerase recycling motor ATPase HelR [Amycolatopsis oliviviridis]|uniref:DNA helicase n=1 Tax=Amycolatopsis oliviviridis TaxID=1471590 RepID=A0ABQ3LSU3_9PSEU|nr:RNA polymerase recycling motor ATPase HelR [Amycolatopsis oliviviridis]GHH23231.1 DNA helicase [Amycolatopsis oliviviridis]